ncbi:hypothetical protein F2Q68_00012442 [Brassica cretica]|uniref:Uncharacterized protein n=1 Tax=Brassica cretica TaxID=69181 RepID=A0A8S9KS29_BRACR|nr:hypothetical protein F2Q68_00012442 [Brassica cretica]
MALPRIYRLDSQAFCRVSGIKQRLAATGYYRSLQASGATWRGRSGHVAPGDGDASDLAVSLLSRRSERVSQRLHGVAPVRSLPCTARPMITFITSFELQMHPNVSKNSMWYSNT